MKKIIVSPNILLVALFLNPALSYAQSTQPNIGEANLPDGSVYHGEMVNGVFQGHGTLTSKNGDVYEGDFANGVFNGKGKQTQLDGTTFVGEFKNGMRNGHGVYTSKEETFECDFVNDKANGFGKNVHKSGVTTEGFYKDNLLSGKGKITYKNGSGIEGNFENNNPNGEMIVNDPYGNKYLGNMVDGEFTGSVTVLFKTGDKYEGELKNFIPEGKGVYTYKNGAKFSGNFHEGKYLDKPSAEARILLKTGRTVVGNFVNEKDDSITIESFGNLKTTYYADEITSINGQSFDDFIQMVYNPTFDPDELKTKIKDLIDYINSHSEFDAIVYLRKFAFDVRKQDPDSLTNNNEVLAKAVDLYPDNLVAAYGLAFSYQIAGYIDRALDIYKPILDKRPDLPFLSRSLGYCYKIIKDYSKSVAFYEKAIENINTNSNNDADEVYTSIAAMYKKLNDWDNAEKNILKALELNTDDKDYCYSTLASIYVKKKDFGKALDSAQKALTLDDSISNHNQLAYVYDSMEDTKNVISEANIVLQRDPKNAYAMLMLGEAFIDMKQYEQARDILLKASEQDSDESNIYFYLAKSYQYLRDPESALKYSYKYAQSDPKENSGRYQLQVLHALEANKDLDFEEFDKKSNDAVEVIKKADDLFCKHGYEEAIGLYEQAKQINPFNDYVWLRLGQSYFSTNNDQKSLECVRTAYKLNSYYPDNVQTLAFVLKELNLLDEHNELVREYSTKMPGTKAFLEMANIHWPKREKK